MNPVAGLRTGAARTWEVGAYLALSGTLAWLLFGAIGQPEAPGWPWGEPVSWFRGAAVLVAVAAMMAPRFPEALRGWLGLGAVSLACMAVAAHLLRTTAFSLGGDSQDSGFIIEQLIAAKYYGWPVDGTYQGLSAFYPPLYTQLLGKLAAAFDFQAAAMWKIFGLAMTILAPAAAYALWTRLTTHATALLIVVGFAFSAPVLHLHKTHEWASLLVFMPWWLGDVMGLARHDGRMSAPGLSAAALVGALIFTTFYYWFFVGAVALLLAAVLRRRACGPGPMLDLPGLAVLAGSALLAAPYWLPLLTDMLTIDNRPMQQRWFSTSMNALPLRLHWDLSGVVELLGMLFLLLVPWPAKKERIRALLGGLRVVFVAYLLWYVLGRIAVELDAPILHAKARPMMLYVLYAACAVGAVELATATASSAVARGAIAVALALVAAQNVDAYAGLQGTAWLDKALAKGRDEPERSVLSKTKALNGLRGKTVLTFKRRHIQYMPAFQFLGVSAHYAHPAARFDGRYGLLKGLVLLEDSSAVCLLLRHNAFVPVDYVWWPEKATKVVFLDDFPNGIRNGHLKWKGAGRHGECLAPAGKGGWMKQMLRVQDPGLARAGELGPAARALARRYGDGALRAAIRD